MEQFHVLVSIDANEYISALYSYALNYDVMRGSYIQGEHLCFEMDLYIVGIMLIIKELVMHIYDIDSMQDDFYCCCHTLLVG